MRKGSQATLGQSQHPEYKDDAHLLRLTDACYGSQRLYGGVSAAGPQGCGKEEQHYKMAFPQAIEGR